MQRVYVGGIVSIPVYYRGKNRSMTFDVVGMTDRLLVLSNGKYNFSVSKVDLCFQIPYEPSVDILEDAYESDDIVSNDVRNI